MSFKNLFNSDVQSTCVVIDVVDGKEKVVELGKDFDKYFDDTYGKAIKEQKATANAYEGMRKATIYFSLASLSAFLLQRKLKKRSERQYNNLCDDIFSDSHLDDFVVKAFEEQFGDGKTE